MTDKILEHENCKNQDNVIKEFISSCLIECVNEENLIEEVTKQSKRGVHCKCMLFAGLIYHYLSISACCFSPGHNQTSANGHVPVALQDPEIFASNGRIPSNRTFFIVFQEELLLLVA